MDLGLGVEDVRFEVQGLWFGVKGPWFRVYGSGFGGWGTEFEVQCPASGVWGQGIGRGVEVLRFRP